ncbi:MAG: RsmE family RNA methyltransferase [Candidatus Omnitrophota bacterium]|nr:16S rRNA (uracil(1498)-N(3))-methyltransferase [Candidatus Omnitrophota bacterium]
MPVFYCLNKNIVQDKISITDIGQLHHIKNVLRIKANELVTIFDEKGNRYEVFLQEAFKDYVNFRIVNIEIVQQASLPRLTLACAIPKKTTMDDIVSKLTQLGVDSIIPMQTKRVVIKLDNAKKLAKLKRWEKIAYSSSQQSQRRIPPVISSIQSIEEVTANAGNFDLRIMPVLTGNRKNLKDLFVSGNPINVIVLIGPEGDFTLDEICLAQKNGFIAVNLGANVLRVETAACAVASFIRLYANH